MSLPGRTILSLLLLAALLAGWEAACRLLGIRPLVIPTPSLVFETLLQEIASGRLQRHLAVTAAEMLAGLGLGAVIGLLGGLLLAEFPRLGAVLRPYLVASQVVPKLALGPLFLIWFGFGPTSVVVITALVCFFPLMEATLTGLTEVPPAKLELFRLLKAGRLQTLLRLRLPHGLPVILSGLRVAVVLALVGAVVGEFVGAREGLGAAIIAAQGMMDTSLMFALFVAITALGMAAYHATLLIERALLARFPRG